MATSLQIGRIGLDIDMEAPMRWDESGGRVSLSGVIVAPSTDAERLWQAEQILNLAGPTRSELAVPLISTAWPERNGWYEVLSTDVSPEVGFVAGASRMRWSASLRRLRGGAMPRYELRRLGHAIANDHSINRGSSTGFVAFPASATAPDFGSDVTWSRWLRTSDTGGMVLVTGGGTTLYDTIVSLQVPIADAYVGAARIEYDVTGSGSWKTVVGKDMRWSSATRWRISNGLVRCSWDATGKALVIEGRAGSSWEALDEKFSFSTGGASLTAINTDPVAVTVVRNDAARVTVQLLLPLFTDTHRVALFLSLRRGDLNILGSLKSSSSRQFGIVPSATTAVTSLTSAIHRTSNDTLGNRWVVSSPRTWATTDLAHGNLYLTSGSKSFPFGIGFQPDGTSAAGIEGVGNIRSHYYAQPGEQIYVTLP
jgi:hypothetical protein